MVNLRERNVPAPVHCPLCRCAPETTIHALWSCCLLKPVRHSFIEEFRAAVNVDRTITTTNTVMRSSRRDYGLWYKTGDCFLAMAISMVWRWLLS
ncbi:hypothetical protein ACOSQ2_020339 [Xanthoceras sorbifolium]